MTSTDTPASPLPLPLARLAFSGDALEAVFQEGDGDTLLVTFGSMNLAADGQGFWGATIARKSRMPALGFVARRPNWYPALEMNEALLQLRPLLARFQRIVVYGASMGGYAAIRFSADLGAQTVIAFSPQISIDPQQVGHFDTRFSQHHDPERNAGMEIRPEHVAGMVFVFHDPGFARDLGHVEALHRIIPGLVSIPCIRTGHDTVRLFAGTELATGLIRACSDRSIDAVRTMASIQRKRSPLRPLMIAHALLPKRLDQAKAIYLRYSASFNDNDLFGLNYEMAGAAMLAGDLDLAESRIRIALQIRPEDAGTIRRLTDILVRRRKFAQAQIWCAHAVSLVPDYAFGYSRLAEVHLALGNRFEAHRAAERAATLAPNDAKLSALLARTVVSAGDRAGNARAFG